MSETYRETRATESNDASKSYLRPEPNSLSWEALSNSQRVAFKQIVRSLGQVWARRDDDSVTAFYERSKSALKRVLWIDGGRGMGKSTLLKSVARAIATRRDWNAEITAFETSEKEDSQKMREGELKKQIEAELRKKLSDECKKQLDSDDKVKCAEDAKKPFAPGGELKGLEFYRDIKSDIEELQGRVVWLDPLELELLPGEINLLAAILARLEDALRRVSKRKSDDNQMRGLLERRDSGIDPFHLLTKLMADVTLAWDGNTQGRGAHVDPDMLSREVNRAEKIRLNLAAEFRKVIDTIASAPEWLHGDALREKPIFVVSIDDCDLSPERCL